jgi:hypothetical protein
MHEGSPIRTALLVVAAAFGFLLGYLIFDDSAELQSLRTEIEHAKRLARAGESERRPPRLPIAQRLAPDESASSRSVPKGLAQFGVTPEEWESAIELARRAAEGEYILKWERASSKKILDGTLSQIVSEAEPKRAAEYDPLFEELGLVPAVADQLKTHVAKIHRASLEVEGAIQQVLAARQAYDQRLHTLLDDEGVSRA